jgi:hypothetical protein
MESRLFDPKNKKLVVSKPKTPSHSFERYSHPFLRSLPVPYPKK